MKHNPIVNQSHILGTSQVGATSAHRGRRTVKIHPNQGVLLGGTVLAKLNDVYFQAEGAVTGDPAGILAMDIDTGAEAPLVQAEILQANPDNLTGVVDVSDIEVNAGHITAYPRGGGITAVEALTIAGQLDTIGIVVRNVEEMPLGSVGAF